MLFWLVLLTPSVYHHSNNQSLQLKHKLDPVTFFTKTSHCLLIPPRVLFLPAGSWVSTACIPCLIICSFPLYPSVHTHWPLVIFLNIPGTLLLQRLWLYSFLNLKHIAPKLFMAYSLYSSKALSKTHFLSESSLPPCNKPTLFKMGTSPNHGTPYFSFLLYFSLWHTHHLIYIIFQITILLLFLFQNLT